jgi:hypothetical protein
MLPAKLFDGQSGIRLAQEANDLFLYGRLPSWQAI